MSRNSYVKFDTKIRDFYGSNNTAIVFSRLVYWFNKKPDGFYKFKQPCKRHALYKKGDSWGEELGMSRKVLDPIFSRLINHHLTKSAYNKATDKFNGKIFASYTNHKTNQTHYFINWEAYKKFIATVSPSCPLPKASRDVPKETISVPKIQSCDVPLDTPLACARLNTINTQTTTSLTKSSKTINGDTQSEEVKLISKKMVEIWNTHMQDKVVWFKSYAQSLYDTLQMRFRGCLENFKQYCLSMASADFLTGKASNSSFKAYFFWAIKQSTIDLIMAGAYGVKKFFTMQNPQERQRSGEIRELNQQLKIVESKISNHIKEIKEGQDKQIKEAKKVLTDKELATLRQESDKDCLQRYPHLATGENSKYLLNAHFETFLDGKLRAQLGFSENIIVPQEFVKEKAYLEFQLHLIEKTSKLLFNEKIAII